LSISEEIDRLDPILFQRVNAKLNHREVPSSTHLGEPNVLLDVSDTPAPDGLLTALFQTRKKNHTTAIPMFAKAITYRVIKVVPFTVVSACVVGGLSISINR
jgi:hypothetical protein